MSITLIFDGKPLFHLLCLRTGDFDQKCRFLLVHSALKGIGKMPAGKVRVSLHKGQILELTLSTVVKTIYIKNTFIYMSKQ